MNPDVSGSFSPSARFDRTGTVPLPDWGVIRASGEDARSFLHGQLTQDVLHLEPGRARLAGYCSAKGRLLASFVVWAEAGSGDVLLACSADLLPAALKRLSMFVLRAKCRLTDAALPVHGVVGAAAADGPAWRVRTDGEGRTWIRLPDAAGAARALVLGPAPALEPLPADDWRRLEVASAVPRIVAATSEAFVPQMINLEVVGGVNFQKGCYPGQEVVARSQYRGTLKRRAFVLQTDAELAAGQEVFDAADPGQPAGQVVLAAPGAALVELKLAAVQAGAALHAGAADGPALRSPALPYELPADGA